MLQLSDKAREIHMLTGIWTTLLSVTQCANEGYTIIFHPFDSRYTVHQPGSIDINLSREAILPGWQDASGL